MKQEESLSPRRSAAVPHTATLIVAAIAVVLVGYPIARLIPSAQPGAALSGPGLATAAWHTVVLAVVVTICAVPLGAAIALVLRDRTLPARRTLQVAMLLPLVIPQFVLGYSWTQAYGRAGFTDSLVGISWSGLFGPVGIVVVLTVNVAPLCYLLTLAGLHTRAQPQLEYAARASGASARTVLITITLPLLRPALCAAGALTFVSSLESFAVPQVLGAPSGFDTIATRIYADLSLGSDPATFDEAITLALGLVLLAAIVLVPADLFLTPRLRSTRTAQPPAIPVRERRRLRARLLCAILWLYLAAAIGLPSVALIAAAITRAVGLPPTPSNWTLDNFTALGTANTAHQVEHSVELAAAAACILVVLGAVMALHSRSRSAGPLTSATTLALVVPGSTLAVGVLLAYGRWLDGTLTLILLAYLAKLWALAARPIAGAADRLPEAELQAARTSGAGQLVALRTVLLPALGPALAGAWLLVFLTALHEVTMSSLLYSTGTETVAVALLNSQELGDIGQTAALSVALSVLVLVMALVMIGLLRLADRRRRTPIVEVLGVR